MSEYNVIIVDDERMHRNLFKLIVESSDKYKIAELLSSAEGVHTICEKEKIDIVIMDIVMKNGVNGIEEAQKIKEVSPDTKILIVTSMLEASFLRQARKIGVEAFWYKEFEEEPLLEVIDRVMSGETCYPDEIPSASLGTALSSDFTEREIDVLREIVSGVGNNEIAEKLDISVNTVRFHVSSLLSKTGCNSRTELAICAAKSGIVFPEK